MINKYTLSCTLNSSGAGTATTATPINGEIMAVEIDYPSHDVTISIATLEAVPQTFLNMSATHTDQVVYPNVIQDTNDGTDLTYDGTRKVYNHYVVFGHAKLTCASGTEADVVTVHILVKE